MSSVGDQIGQIVALDLALYGRFDVSGDSALPDA